MRNDPVAAPSGPFDPVPRPARPTAVWVATILLVLTSILGLAGVGMLAVLLEDLSTSDLLLIIGLPAAMSIVTLVLAVFLFRGVPWARTTLIVLMFANIVLSIISAIIEPSGICLGLVVNIVLLVILFRDDVKDWCYPY